MTQLSVFRVNEVGAKLINKLPLDLQAENGQPLFKRKLRNLLVQGAFYSVGEFLDRGELRGTNGGNMCHDHKQQICVSAYASPSNKDVPDYCPTMRVCRHNGNDLANDPLY
ncbi:hypothetical protein J6590_016037 [Homalodisca vitripennis]|nr:hypothetical protein J6590_016037 [Homalodisca vitripennis]